VEGNEMTRSIKITLLVAAILGLGCGGYRGHQSAVEISDSLKSIQYSAPTKVASDFARIQFMRADTDHARQAVMLQIRLLEQLAQAGKTFREGGGELWLAYIRLAMIEEAAGRPDAEQSAMTQARALYNRDHPHGQEQTYDELKNVILRFDKAADNL
jgi:hypothetical protein